jgi:arylsulfatase A-like enzyme
MMRFGFYIFLSVCLLASSLSGCFLKRSKIRKVSKVILISIDTLRADFLGSYNKRWKTTPNLDRFAAENLLFTNVVSQAPSTAISHKSIFYSLYPAIHKTSKESVPMEKQKSPIEVLQRSGFKTAAFVGGAQLSRKLGFARGFDTYWEPAGKRGPEEQKQNLKEIEPLAFDWLRQNRTDKFFLFLHTYEVHRPYDPPQRYVDRFVERYDGNVERKGNCGATYYNKRPMSAEDYEYIRQLYSAGVAYVDDFMARLLTHLKALNLYDHTMIIFISDHGESLGERGYVGHNQLYNVQLQIPLIIRLPGAEARRIESPIEAIDIMPLIFSVFRLEPDIPFQGIDLLPIIVDAKEPPRDRVRISEQNDRVRVQKGTLVYLFSRSNPDRNEMYDLQKDPEERNNLFRKSSETINFKGVYFRMLQDARQISSQFISKREEPQIDRELEEQLKALGYTQ